MGAYWELYGVLFALKYTVDIGYRNIGYKNISVIGTFFYS